MTAPLVDVAIVGGGPAGLAAAVRLRRAGATVTVLERESALGGVARHADHTGYGLREFKRLLRGPDYARRWTERVEHAGAEVRVETTVTGWARDGASAHRLALTSPFGVDELGARAVVLATGTRERPRSARLVPGTRPVGVLTTGALQQMVKFHDLPIGRRAVIVGAEHVSFSAVLTLAHAGCEAIAMTTPEPRHQSYAALRLATATRHHVPLLTGTVLSAIRGRRRVAAVELTDVGSGATRVLECDTVVFTGDWIAEHELARRGGLVMDEGTRGPRVDTMLRTSVPGVFAAGNLLHGAETAGVCAASGAWAAGAMLEWLGDTGQRWPDVAVPLECEPPLRWVSPNAVVPAAVVAGRQAVPHRHLLARSSVFARWPRITVRQGERELWAGRIRRAVPTMPVHIPVRWLDQVEVGAPVHISMAG